jgi:hypothetical protein
MYVSLFVIEAYVINTEQHVPISLDLSFPIRCQIRIHIYIRSSGRLTGKHWLKLKWSLFISFCKKNIVKYLWIVSLRNSYYSQIQYLVPILSIRSIRMSLTLIYLQDAI